MTKKIEIQDNIRENQLIRLFKLKKTNKNRIGVDATLRFNNRDTHFELKSTTTGRISTASPLNLEHIKKWRKQHWIIGIYDKRARLKYCHYGRPKDMKKWLDYWEEDIKRGLKISDLLVERINLEMVYDIFGKKKYYTLDEAKYVFKNLYSLDEYYDMMNHNKGFRPLRMLEMFREHNQVYLYRGSSRNNPKISKGYYEHWPIIKNNYAKELRKILRRDKNA